MGGYFSAVLHLFKRLAPDEASVTEDLILKFFKESAKKALLVIKETWNFPRLFNKLKSRLLRITLSNQLHVQGYSRVQGPKKVFDEVLI